MNYSTYKEKNFFIKSLLIINIIYLLASNINSEDKLYEEIINKRQFNEEILKEVLRGAGLSFKDASLATKSFKIAYPPEMLTESSYLNFTFAKGKLDSFAINIDGTDAVLITKLKIDLRLLLPLHNMHTML